MFFEYDKIPWVDSFLCSMTGCEKDYKEEWGWFRYQVGGKLYAACLKPDSNHAIYGGKNLLTVKCDSQTADFMRCQYDGILPGFYMNKQYWVSIDIDAGIPEEVIKELCATSYKLVFSKLTKKMQAEINSTYNK